MGGAVSTASSRIDAPSRVYTALEVRAFAERAAMVAAGPLLRRLPKGDGHPVLVLPGFVASDLSTVPLRRVLDDLGYVSKGWRLGANMGPTPEIVGGMMKRFDHIARHHDQPVSVVGWSLGGIYAREIARRFPDAVRQVITLGSPIHMRSGDQSAASGAWDLLRSSHDPAVMNRTIPEMEKPRLTVPATSIYTRSDGVVHWTTCLIERTPISENVEVFSSHCGLGVNPWVAYVIANRLAQSPHDWTRFSAPLMLRGGFPRATDWRAPQPARDPSSASS